MVESTTGETERKNSKIKIKEICMILGLLAVIGCCGGFLWNYYTPSKPPARVRVDHTIAPAKDIGPLDKKVIKYPLALKEAKNQADYQIRASSRIFDSISRDKKSGPVRTRKTHVNAFVICPAKIKGDLRMKIYKGNAPNGIYQLVYDRIATLKPNRNFSSRIRLPDNFENAPEAYKKKYLERRRNVQRSINGGRVSDAPRMTASFTYIDEKPHSESDKMQFYRLFLCDRDGRLIKESLPSRPDIHARTSLSRSRAGMSRNRNVKYWSKPDRFQWLAMFPSFSRDQRWLTIWAKQRDIVNITGFFIDGVKYVPVVTKGKLSRVSFGRKRERVWSSTLKLNYPFGGNVKLDFSYKSENGKVKNEFFEFYMPPPAPVVRLRADSVNKGVEISWSSLKTDIKPAYYSTLPQLILFRNSRQLTTFNPGTTDKYLDKDIFFNEPLKYYIRLGEGVCRTARWTALGGREEIELRCSQSGNPFQKYGATITLHDNNAKPHPVRIELLSNFICYENTGVTACKTLETIINKFNTEKDMVIYDRQSREYIIDEKYFALSKELKKQFLMSESDYAVQLRDFSRQDGNGIEVWLFKKVVDEVAKTKKTEYWRIGAIKTDGTGLSAAGVANKLVKKIRDTLDFKVCNDSRERHIKPANVICSEFLPVNEKSVIWNYTAISESLFLALENDSDKIKILAQSDWDQIFRERIARFDKGHSFIDKMVREVLLIGRMWRSGSGKSYYIQACDAFTGEVLGCKVVSGKLQDAASELSGWISRLRLSNDIKVDFHYTRYHRQYSRQRLSRPWGPKNNMLKNYGPHISRPGQWLYRSYYNQTTAASGKSGSKDFYTFVKRQWKDGFRARAIQLLEEDWGKSKKTPTGYLLSGYYCTVGNYKKAAALYDILVQRDDCPDSIISSYNHVKQQAEKQTATPQMVSSSSKAGEKELEPGLRETLAYYKSYLNVDGRSIYKSSPVKGVEKDKYLNKYYFIDRGYVYAEWAPGQPCRTGKIALSVPWKRLRQDLENEYFKEFGMVIKSFHRSAFDASRSGHLLEQWKLPRKNDAAVKMTPQNVFIVAGWNSIDPLSDVPNAPVPFTRLGYFLKMFPGSSRIGLLYDHSILRAVIELIKTPDIKMPRFSYYDKEMGECVLSVSKGEDILRYYANFALARYKLEAKTRYGFSVSGLKLHELLCLEYLSGKGYSQYSDLFNRILNIEVPDTIEKYRNKRVGDDFVVFMAHRKNQAAIKLIPQLDVSSEDAHNYAYLLAKAGLNKIAGDLICRSSFSVNADAASIRWAPESFLNYFLDNYSLKSNSDMYCFLLFGLRNDSAARNLFLSYRTENRIINYFGKPSADAYLDWRIEHLKKLSELNKNKEESPAQ